MSTKAFGCFFCPASSNDPQAHCPDCGRPIDVGVDLLKAPIEAYRPHSVLGRGFYGWTLLVEDEYQRFAMKVIPTHRQERKQPSDTEARALARCSVHRNLARFFRAFLAHASVGNDPVTVFCLLFDYIENARPLSALIADDNIRLDAHDVVAILTGIASGLGRMHAVNLWHDDLHDDNVLVRRVDADENLSERFESKIIDFGSAKTLSMAEPEHGERGDYFYLAKHIGNVVARFEAGNLATRTPGDRDFAARLRRLAREIADPNVSRRALSPLDIAGRIRDAMRFAGSASEFPPVDVMLREKRTSLKHPFDNPNALRLEAQDINLLFIDELGWTRRISIPQPVIIVGPRGCGKTMLLRHLSLRSQGRPRRDETSREEIASRLTSMRHLGVLVSCSDVRTPFFRSSFKKLQAADPHRAEDFCREYLNLHFAIELSRCLLWLANERLAPVSTSQLGSLEAALAQLLKPTPPWLPEPAVLDSLVGAIERRATELSNLTHSAGYEPSNLCRDDVLEQLAVAVRSCQWFADKEVWFLLDDYTVPLLPEFVQEAYNPVLFRPPGSFRLRLSSEGDGPVLQDTFGRRYSEGREFSRVNLGEVYFDLDEKDCRLFLEKIVARRFEEAGEASLRDLQELLGEHPNESGFGDYIRDQGRAGDARFHGFGLICHLCSGDIGSVLELFGKLYGAHSPDARLLRPRTQDKIVKSFAHGELRSLRPIHEWGPRIYDFAVGVGRLLKEYLRSPSSQRADERLRIEIEGAGELSPTASAVHQQLLQHSVLISGGAGKDRKGLPTQKYFFRRMYAPCFPFSPARRGCIPLSVEKYERWLNDPAAIQQEPSASEATLFDSRGAEDELEGTQEDQPIEETDGGANR